MNPSAERTRAHRLKNTVRAAPRILAWTIALIVGAAASAQGITTYSGASVGSNGTIYGWGVTDAYVGGMVHTAYVTTTLNSPHGRLANSGRRSGTNTVRADLSLPWDPTDLGVYFTTTDHEYWCWIVLTLFPLGQTDGQTTVPYVLLSLVTTGTIPNDNAGRTAFSSTLGTTSLATTYYSTQAYWGNGVEIIGTVYPANFSDTITIHREVREDRIFRGSSLYQQSAPPIYDDTSYPPMREDYPQSGGSAAKVYDLDAPGISGSGTAPGTIWRIRTNFRQWAVLNSMGLVVSPINLYWYSRVSIIETTGSDQLKTDVSGDNVAGVGQTRTTWNLQ
jgi:hypothetical protein